MYGLSTVAWALACRQIDGAAITHMMHSFETRQRVVRRSWLGTVVAVLPAILLLSCSPPATYTIVELDESMAMDDKTPLDGESLHPPSSLGQEWWVTPSDCAVISRDQFVTAGMQPFGVALYNMADATARVLPLAFGQGPQELEEIGSTLVTDHGISVLDASRQRRIQFTLTGEFVRNDTFTRPVLAKVGAFAVCPVDDDLEDGYVVGVLTSWDDLDSVIHEIRVPTSVLSARGLSTEAEREFLSWHVASGASVVVFASEFFDIVGVVETEPFSASWFVLDDQRGSVARIRRNSLEREHPAVLIAGLEVTDSGNVLLGRGIGRLSENGEAKYQIDVFDVSMQPQATIVVGSKPDIIAAGNGRLIVGSRPPRRGPSGFTVYEWQPPSATSIESGAR